MPHHHNRLVHDSDRSRRTSTQHESPLEKYRKAVPTLAIGHATKKEWKYVIYPYRNEVEKNIAWVAERPSFADELLKFLQVGSDLMTDVVTMIDGGLFVDQDLRGLRAALQKAYQDGILYHTIQYVNEFERQHTLSVPEGPEARLLRQFFKYTYYFLVEAEHLPALGKADAELRRACEVQKAMCSAARSRVENGHALSRKLKELEKKMQAVNSASWNMDQLHGIESELEQIDREALQLRTEVNSRYGELEEALKTPRRLWKEKHPDQCQKKSKLVRGEIISKIKRLSDNSKRSSSSESS